MKANRLVLISRYLALMFAVGLGIGEAVINWGHWQYAPLWIVDYVIVAWLLWAFWRTKNGRDLHLLSSAWSFAMGVFYMALFVSIDPENRQDPANFDTVVLVLMGLMLILSGMGFACVLLAKNGNFDDSGQC